ncbi:MAG: FHA domain-containing protein [Bacteroidales bacterium]|nr:FHA domain-containing protein [Bacteroidales bacterium]
MNIIIRLFLAATLIISFSACNQEKTHSGDIYSGENFKYKIKIMDRDYRPSNKADTLIFPFSIYTENDKKIFVEDFLNLKRTDIKIQEFPFKDSKFPEFIEIKDIRGERRITGNIIFSFLIDRSSTIQDADMLTMKNTIEDLVNTLPDSVVNISFFDNESSSKGIITGKTFDQFENEFYVSKAKNKIFYKAIENNFSDLINSDPLNDSIQRFLIVFTDGKVKDLNTVYDEYNSFFEKVSQTDRSFNQNAKIYTFSYGSDLKNDKDLEQLCVGIRQDDFKGGFFRLTEAPKILPEFINTIVDPLKADYELVLRNPSEKKYTGQPLTLTVKIEKDEKEKAIGSYNYKIGSPNNPIETGADNTLLYVIFGLVLIFIVFFILQVVVPYFIYKYDNFEKKHVISYTPSDDSSEECYMCQERFMPGDRVVVKCHHKTHWLPCWQENGHKCLEYGQNCDKGIQHFFDKTKPFDTKKSPYYLKWVLTGLFGGLLAWVLYRIFDAAGILTFESLTMSLVETFYTKDKATNEIIVDFTNKIRGFLVTGITLGFILTFLFTWVNEFRQKTSEVLLFIFLRTIIGAIIGFITFLLGSVICIYLDAPYNNPYVDWIPWLLFGAGIGLCISVKTTIKWMHALSGGLIAGILSFLVLLLTTGNLGSFGVMMSYMLCSAIIGLSIITVHHSAQKYFLRYKDGKKEGEIAIHKWMSVVGGSNPVTIGKANDCIIQMNWDKNENISDKQAKLYIDKKRNIPVLKVLENGMFFDNRETKKDNEYLLKDGVKFQIGSTEFQYVEKM